MNGGFRPKVRATLFAGLAVVTLALVGRADQSQAPHPLELRDLMARMATASGVVAKFREHKQLALLALPLESSGVLYFAPPGRLARFTQEPSPSSLIIDGEELRFREGADGEEFDLSGSPMARIFVDNFIVLFNGDLEELKRRYQTSLSGTADDWRLELLPRASLLSRVMERISLRGDQRGIHSMVMLATDGDVTTTTLESVDADHHFSEAELSTLFSQRIPLSLPASQN